MSQSQATTMASNAGNNAALNGDIDLETEGNSTEEAQLVHRLLSATQRRANRNQINGRCLRRLNPDLDDFVRIGHSGVYRYLDDGPRWVSKRVEGQLFVTKTPTPPVRVQFLSVMSALYQPPELDSSSFGT